MDLRVAMSRRWFLTPILGEMIQFDEHIFQMGWNHQLEWCFFLETEAEVDLAFVVLANVKWKLIELQNKHRY